MNTLVADASGIYWRHYFGSHDAEQAVAGAVRHVLDAASAHERVYIACDPRPEVPLWRKELLPEYKTGRDHNARPEAAWDGLQRFVEELASRGCPPIRIDGNEGDDICASVARAESLDGNDVTVLGADKDLLQLVMDARDDSELGAVRVRNAFSNAVYDEAAVVEKLGVLPALVPHLLAIGGDSTDKIPGVAGVGQEQAARLLALYGSAEKLFLAAAGSAMAAHLSKEDFDLLESLPPWPEGGANTRSRNALVKDGAHAAYELCLKLTMLRSDLEVPAGIDAKAISFEPAAREPDPPPEEDRPPERLPDVPAATPKAIAPSENASTELARRDVNDPSQQLIMPSDPEFAAVMEPRTPQALWWLAGKVVESRRFANLRNQADAYMVLMLGREMGLSALTAIRGIHIVEGRPTLAAALMVSLIRRSPLCKYWLPVEISDERAEWKTCRTDDYNALAAMMGRAPTPEEVVQAGIEYRFAWTDEDVKAAGKDKPDSNHRKFKRQMKSWRAQADLGRQVYPEIVMNVYVDGELG